MTVLLLLILHKQNFKCVLTFVMWTDCIVKKNAFEWTLGIYLINAQRSLYAVPISVSQRSWKLTLCHAHSSVFSCSLKMLRNVDSICCLFDFDFFSRLLLLFFMHNWGGKRAVWSRSNWGTPLGHRRDGSSV